MINVELKEDLEICQKDLICGVNAIPEWQISEVISWAGPLSIPIRSIRLKENKAIYMASQWAKGNLEIVKEQGVKPQDVLRMLCCLSGVGPSLVKTVDGVGPAKFFNKLGRPQRRAVIGCLNNVKTQESLEEELYNHMQLWKPLLRGLHIFEPRSIATNKLKQSIKRLVEDPNNLYRSGKADTKG